MKKIGIVSFRHEAKEFDKTRRNNKNYRRYRWANIPASKTKAFNKKRLDDLLEVKESADSLRLTHILFPGDTLLVNKQIYYDATFENDLNYISKLFHDYSLLLEVSFRDTSFEQISPPVDTGIVAFEKGTEIGERIQQLFAHSDDDEFFYKRLSAEIAWGHRIRELDGIKFLIFICGELNFFKCSQKNNYKVQLRYNFDGNRNTEKVDYDLFYNPIHTPMGEAHLIHKKLKYMSDNNRAAIQVSNIPTFQKSVKSASYCHIDGSEVEFDKTESEIDKDSWLMRVVAV